MPHNTQMGLWGERPQELPIRWRGAQVCLPSKTPQLKVIRGDLGSQNLTGSTLATPAECNSIETPQPHNPQMGLWSRGPQELLVRRRGTAQHPQGPYVAQPVTASYDLLSVQGCSELC